MDNNQASLLYRGQVLPHNIEAEQSVLGCALSDEKGLAEVTGVLHEADFYEPRHRCIFRAMLDLMLQSRAVDMLTVNNWLAEQKLEEAVGGLPYLSTLLSQPFSPDHVQDYTSIVREKAILRRLITELTEVTEASMEQKASSDELLNMAAKKIYQIRENQGDSGMELLKDVLSRQLQDLMQPKPKHQNVPSGFSGLDRCLGGFGRGTLTILAARPGMGKSALALNIGTTAAVECEKTVVVFSLEMSKEEIASRILASYSRVDSHALKNHELTKSDWDSISQSLMRFVSSRFYIDDRSGTTTTEMMSKCRQLKMDHDLGLVIIDYLQLMSTGSRRSENRQQEISEISRSLKLMAKELEVPVLALSQLSRACEARENKRPLLSDLRESGSLEQDADAVLFLYRSDYYDQNELPGDYLPAELHVAKNRSGSMGKIQLGWMPRYTWFFDPDTRSLEPPVQHGNTQSIPVPEEAKFTPPPPPPPPSGDEFPVDLEEPAAPAGEVHPYDQIMGEEPGEVPFDEEGSLPITE